VTQDSAAHTSRSIEEIAVLLEADGLPRVAGRLFGLLLMSEEPRSLDELADQLGVSKPSVSVNARLLEQRGVVERAGMQGDRRDYYRISSDILERSLEQRLGKIRRFQEAIAVARAHCTARQPAVRDRLQDMDEAYRHLLDATSHALQEWRGKKGHAPKGTTPSPSKSR
jgi:DNA-binding transcriptional regulator GbsR (MarR family)